MSVLEVEGKWVLEREKLGPSEQHRLIRLMMIMIMMVGHGRFQSWYVSYLSLSTLAKRGKTVCLCCGFAPRRLHEAFALALRIPISS